MHSEGKAFHDATSDMWAAMITYAADSHVLYGELYYTISVNNKELINNLLRLDELYDKAVVFTIEENRE